MGSPRSIPDVDISHLTGSEAASTWDPFPSYGKEVSPAVDLIIVVVLVVSGAVLLVLIVRRRCCRAQTIVTGQPVSQGIAWLGAGESALVATVTDDPKSAS